MSVGSDALLSWLDGQEPLRVEKERVYDKLARWKVKGTYEAERARRAFSAVLRRAAESYASAGLASSRKANVAFPKDDRDRAAQALEKDFSRRFKQGQWAELQAEQAEKDRRAKERRSRQQERALARKRPSRARQRTRRRRRR